MIRAIQFFLAVLFGVAVDFASIHVRGKPAFASLPEIYMVAFICVWLNEGVRK